MEKGEALNIWSRRNKGGLDHMTALQVRSSSLRAPRFEGWLVTLKQIWKGTKKRYTIVLWGLQYMGIAIHDCALGISPVTSYSGAKQLKGELIIYRQRSEIKVIGLSALPCSRLLATQAPKMCPADDVV